MGIKSGNEWNPNGDYCQEFIDEVNRKVSELETILEELNIQRENCKQNAENTKVTEDTLDSYKLLESRLSNTIEGIKSRRAEFNSFNS